MSDSSDYYLSSDIGMHNQMETCRNKLQHLDSNSEKISLDMTSPLPPQHAPSADFTDIDECEDSSESKGSEYGWEHDKHPQITSAAHVSYCQSCGFPHDFCEFGTNWEICRLHALTKYRKFYRQYLVANNIPSDTNEVAGKADSSSTAEASVNHLDKLTVKIKKGKKMILFVARKVLFCDQEVPITQQITVQRVSRAKHKMATVITGLHLFDIKLDAAAKIFKKRFACGSSVVKGLPGQQDHVEIQGDFEDEIDDVILQNYRQVSKDAIAHLKPK